MSQSSPQVLKVPSEELGKCCNFNFCSILTADQNPKISFIRYNYIFAGMEAHTRNLSTWEVKAGGLAVPGKQELDKQNRKQVWCGGAHL